MIRAGLIALALFSPLPAIADPHITGNADLAPDLVQSGSVFLTNETCQLQEDGFANPGYLWVDRGRALFASRASHQSCLDCHDEDGDQPMKGAATRYPQVDSKTGRLMNLADRINECRAVCPSPSISKAKQNPISMLGGTTFSPAAASSTSLVISVMTTIRVDCCVAIRSAKGIQMLGRVTV